MNFLNSTHGFPEFWQEQHCQAQGGIAGGSCRAGVGLGDLSESLPIQDILG